MNLIVRFYSQVLISIIISVFTAAPLLAQFPVIKNFTVNDGLPSSRIYDIEQDSSGYIWFATENGISRYDGYEFRNFTKPDGLPSNSVIRLYRDYKDRLWYLTYQGEVGYIQNENIYIHWISGVDTLVNITFYDQIFVDTNDVIFLSPYYNGLVKIDGDKLDVVGVQKRDSVTAIRNALYFEKRGNDFILGRINLNNKIEDEVYQSYPHLYLIEFSGNRSSINQAYYHKSITLLHDSSYLVALGPHLVKLENDKVVYKKNFENDIIYTFLDTYGNLWISEQFSGVKFYESADLNSTPIEYLTDYTVSSIIQDYEGSYWFSSTENGLFYVPSAQFVNYDSEYLNIQNDLIQSLAISYPYLFFSTGNRGFYRARIDDPNLKLDDSFQLSGEIISTISNILITSDLELWLPSTQYLRYNFAGQPIKPFDTDYRHNGYDLIELHNGKVLLGFTMGLLEYTRAGVDRESRKKAFNHKALTFCQSEDSIVWIGTIDGLFSMKNQKIKSFMPSSTILSSRISDIECKNSYLVVGTFDNGLVLIRRTDNKIVYINEQEGLASHRVKTLRMGPDNKIWVGTNQGLSEIKLVGKDSLKYEIRNYTIWDGLPSNEINDIAIDGSHIVLGTDDGLVRFDPSDLSLSKYQPQARFVAIHLNDSRFNFINADPVFEFDQNNVEFSFRLKSFKDPQKASYLYKLEGYEDEWYSTKNTSVRYPKLNPGKYRFVLKAKSRAGLWSDTISYDFIIKKHFTQYLAFRISMFVVIGSLGFLIVYLIVSGFRNREELKRQAILAEQKAVRSQMNPHFIFNSLNSIQNFIVDKDDKNANLYLVIFSSLIRRILEASKHNFISLKEEIETIKLYLELEKFRFEKHFNYSIEIDKAINADQTSIPSMLLQPYLENAIWHGIVPKQSKGMLMVEFKLIDAGLMQISITDDGIGRVKAGEINKRRKHHKPTGMKNVEERLNLLNKLNNTNMRVKIIDLYDEQKSALGTRVEFLIEV